MDSFPTPGGHDEHQSHVAEPAVRAALRWEIEVPRPGQRGHSAKAKLTMNIRQAIPTECAALLDVWLQSVRATHTFVSDEDIEAMVPQVRDYLATSNSEFWVISDDSEAIKGFMGMSGSKMDSLFILPEFHRRGAGRQMVRHAQLRHGELTVDVNKQNSAACAFYEACGFVVEGQSEFDEQGRPYPLLHMRLLAPTQ